MAYEDTEDSDHKAGYIPDADELGMFSMWKSFVHI